MRAIKFRALSPDAIDHGRPSESAIVSLWELTHDEDVYWPPAKSATASEAYQALRPLTQPYRYEARSRRGNVSIWAFYFDSPAELLCTWAVEGDDRRWWVRAFANFPMDCGTPWMEEQPSQEEEGKALIDFIFSKTHEGSQKPNSKALPGEQDLFAP